MNEFLTYIDKLVVKYQAEEEMLIKMDRKDEANFAKIRVNICEICKTLYGASMKMAQSRERENVDINEAFKEEYFRQLTRLLENWKISYEKAKEHGDASKIVIEEIKLETLQMVLDKYELLN